MIAQTMTINHQHNITAALIGDDAVKATASVTQAEAAALNAELAPQGLPGDWEWIDLSRLYRVYSVGVGEAAEYYLDLGDDLITIDRDGYLTLIDQLRLHPDGAGGWGRHSDPVYWCWDCRVDEYLVDSEVAI